MYHVLHSHGSSRFPLSYWLIVYYVAAFPVMFFQPSPWLRILRCALSLLFLVHFGSSMRVESYGTLTSFPFFSFSRRRNLRRGFLTPEPRYPPFRISVGIAYLISSPRSSNRTCSSLQSRQARPSGSIDTTRLTRRFYFYVQVYSNG